MSRQGTCAHINALTCPINFLGLNLFYRWLVVHERHPDWGDGPEAYVTLFLTPLLRSQSDPAKPMSYDAHNSLMTAFLQCFRVKTTKVTHFMRGNVAREILGGDCDPRMIESFMHRDYSQMVQSYCTSISPQILCAVAGYDKNDIKSAGAPHLDAVVQQDLDACIEMAFPWLPVEERKVAVSKEEVYASLNFPTDSEGRPMGNKKERTKRSKSLYNLLKDKRLLMREASVQAVREIARVVLRCAAARPRDANHHIVADDQPMYKRFWTHPVYQALSSQRTPVFASAAWARVEAAVAAAENRELAHSVEAPVGSGALTRQIQVAMAPELKGLASRMNSLNSVQQETANAVKEVGDTVNALVPLMRGLVKGNGFPVSTAGGVGLVQDHSPVNEVPLSKSAVPSPQVRLGASRQTYVQPAIGHEQMKEFGQIPNASAMLLEYKRTSALEKNRKVKGAIGYKWRSYRAAANAWYERGPIFRRIARLMDEAGEEAALQDLNNLATTKGSRGKSSAPDWEGIVKDLRQTPHEIELRNATVKRRGPKKMLKTAKKRKEKWTFEDTNCSCSLHFSCFRWVSK